MHRSPVTRIVPSRPDVNKVTLAAAPIMGGVSTNRMKALDEIAKLAGEKPTTWEKPKFGDFEYWLAHNCNWISDEELRSDTEAYNAKRQLARETSHRFSKQRFSWVEQPRHEEPKDTEISMKLVSSFFDERLAKYWVFSFALAFTYSCKCFPVMLAISNCGLSSLSKWRSWMCIIFNVVSSILPLGSDLKNCLKSDLSETVSSSEFLGVGSCFLADDFPSARTNSIAATLCGTFSLPRLISETVSSIS